MHKDHLFFFTLYFSGDRLYPVEDQREGPSWGLVYLLSEACAPRSLIPGPMPATGQLGHITVCTFSCVFARNCGRFPSCERTRPTGIRCERGSAAGGVRRGNARAPLPDSVCCCSAGFYGTHEHMHGRTQTLSQSIYTNNTKKKKKTYFTYFTPLDLKRATRDVCLIFLEEKQIAFEK